MRGTWIIYDTGTQREERSLSTRGASQKSRWESGELRGQSRTGSQGRPQQRPREGRSAVGLGNTV